MVRKIRQDSRREQRRRWESGSLFSRRTALSPQVQSIQDSNIQLGGRAPSREPRVSASDRRSQDGRTSCHLLYGIAAVQLRCLGTGQLSWVFSGTVQTLPTHTYIRRRAGFLRRARAKRFAADRCRSRTFPYRWSKL